MIDANHNHASTKKIRSECSLSSWIVSSLPTVGNLTKLVDLGLVWPIPPNYLLIPVFPQVHLWRSPSEHPVLQQCFSEGRKLDPILFPHGPEPRQYLLSNILLRFATGSALDEIDTCFGSFLGVCFPRKTFTFLGTLGLTPSCSRTIVVTAIFSKVLLSAREMQTCSNFGKSKG